MKAIFQEEYGADTYKLGELPKPTAGDDQVLIKVHAASVNPIDVKRHLFMKGESFPMLAGYDVAGVIEALGGGDTKGLKVGDRVFGEVTANAAAPKTTGAFAEYTVVNAMSLAIIPPNASFEDMAALPVAAGTAMQVFDKIGLKKGMKIFISGGAGGVGVHAIQIAKNVYGAAEVATTASRAKKEFVEKSGADIIVDYRSEDAGEKLAGWADVAMDCTGEPEMVKKVVKKGGNTVSIVTPKDADVEMLMLKADAELMGRLAMAIEEGKLKVNIDTVYSLDDGIKAIEHVAGGRSKGKVVINVC